MMQIVFLFKIILKLPTYLEIAFCTIPSNVQTNTTDYNINAWLQCEYTSVWASLTTKETAQEENEPSP